MTRTGVVAGRVVGCNGGRTALHTLRCLATVYVTTRRRVGAGAICRTRRYAVHGRQVRQGRVVAAPHHRHSRYVGRCPVRKVFARCFAGATFDDVMLPWVHACCVVVMGARIATAIGCRWIETSNRVSQSVDGMDGICRKHDKPSKL